MALAKIVGRFAVSPQVVFVGRRRGARRRCLRRRRRQRHDSARVDDETIAVELAGVISFLHRSAVRYVEADGDYVRLHTAQGSHLLRTTLSELERRWAAAGFLRVHRHTLVSLAHVDHVRLVEGRHEMWVGDMMLPVSRRHVGALRARLREL